MKIKYSNSVSKWLPICVAIALVYAATTLTAQIPTITPEYYGEWNFTKTQAQERPLNSKENHTPRTITKEDFSKYNYFYQIPTYISFMEGNLAEVETTFGISNNLIPAFSPQHDNSLEFLQLLEMEDGETEYGTKMPLFFGITLNDNTMTMKTSYFYSNEHGKYTEGILTLYYKR